MSGHAPEGRAAGGTENASTSTRPDGGRATTTPGPGAAEPPPIPPAAQSSAQSAVSTVPRAAVAAAVAPDLAAAASAPAPTPHLSPSAFAERFLPPHVDASHVISSAAPTSLPIELPAIRADTEANRPAAGAASAAAFSAAALAAASASSSSSRPPVIPPSAAQLRLLSPFERWTLRASESQFNALAGAIGGFTSGIFTCPLDVIKTKLQAQGGFASLQRQAAGASSGSAAAGQSHHRLYNGLVGTARVIWRDEGVRGLYRGLGPIIMGYLPTWAVWFAVYNKSKTRLSEQYHIENTFAINFWSSIVAGASSTIVTNPIWVIKTRLMSQMPTAGASAGVGSSSSSSSRPTLSTPWHYRSTLDAARKMYATEGVLSFYSGLTPALLGLTHVAVQFPAYEYFKTRFTGRGMGEVSGDGEAPPAAHWLGVLSATILSKVLASSLTYPHEVLRTRLQTQRRPAAAAKAGPDGAPRYRGVVTTFKTILREEGWRAFYAGMGTNMMRAVPAATVTMLTYEYVMRSLKQTRHDARLRLEGA